MWWLTGKSDVIECDDIIKILKGIVAFCTTVIVVVIVEVAGQGKGEYCGDVIVKELVMNIMIMMVTIYNITIIR